MLKISRQPAGDPEIFASIQGEGPSSGTPSVFVRLSLCNLRCVWCDTKYTWDWANFDPKSEIISVSPNNVIDQVLTLTPENVVITGGEPLQQQKYLVPFVQGLARHSRRIEVETNGTLVPLKSFAEHVSQWNVSPKLSNSGDPERIRLVAKAISWFAACDSAYFKFVIEAPQDLDEVEEIVTQYLVSRNRVLLSPQGTDAQTLRERSSWLVDECVNRGYRFSPRLHIMIWGDERGK